MKKIKLLLYFFLLWQPFYAVGLNAPQPSPTTSLYSSTRTQLQQYYNRTDFADPDHTTGWYRVDDFLTWLKTHQATLTRDIQDDTYTPQALWVYLGARYVAYQFGIAEQIPLQVKLGEPHQGTRVQVEEATILLDPTANRTAPAAITLGMHEGAHLLPVLAAKSTVLSLSELVSFYAQHQYGLPVEVEDAKWFSYGVRDIRLTASRKGYALVPLSNEYILHVLGLVILPSLFPQKLLEAYNFPLMRSDISLSTALIYWHALTQHQVTYQQQAYTADAFLENLLGTLLRDDTIYTQAYDFFTIVEKELPLSLKEQIDACLPLAIEAPNACIQQLQEEIDKNPPILMSPLLKTLQTTQAPPPPALPHGYL